MVAHPHTLYTWSGVIGTASAPIEQWSFTLKTAQVVTTEIPMQPLADALRTCFLENFVPVLKTNIILTRCRFSNHGPDGHVIKRGDGSYLQADNTVATPGTMTSTVTMPLQTAMVVSLDTARSGPTGKGRFFLPWPQVNLGTDHRLSAADADLYAARAAEFIRDVNLIGNPVAVVSSKGYTSPVTAVRVGRAPDTLRSRRRSLLEGYSRATV